MHVKFCSWVCLCFSIYFHFLLWQADKREKSEYTEAHQVYVKTDFISIPKDSCQIVNIEYYIICYYIGIDHGIPGGVPSKHWHTDRSIKWWIRWYSRKEKVKSRFTKYLIVDEKGIKKNRSSACCCR